MKQFAKLYPLANVLSLDVAFGAIVSAMLFAHVFEVHILPWGYLALGLTVWIIYTVDHLADARSATAPAASRRHRFHQDHFSFLAGLLLITIAIDCAFLFLLRKQVIYSGLVLAIVVVFYFLSLRKLGFAKEFCGACLYSTGVALPAWALSGGPVTPTQRLFIAGFAITVLCNLLLFSLFDRRKDVRDHHRSFSTVMGRRNTQRLLSALFCINGVLLLLQWITYARYQEVIVAMTLMNLVLLVIFMFPKYFVPEDRYRLLGDAIFIVPLFFIAW